ncbi:phage protein [Vibrio phage pTD1]|uniref:Phage protein n=1 Tax=Vibrio phage pTD1 TaxID=1938577 RepID=A0A1Q2U309_9CAUD|nr:phage protein [Vibrio phage pTD1]BAW98343.1 phage protein [Vibrio phage pTD1]
MIYNIGQEDLISFRVVESGLMNSGFEGVTYQGTVGHAVAVMVTTDINIKHQNLRTYFKGAYPDAINPTDYQYILVRHPNGVVEAIGEPWIVKNSLKVVNTQSKTITITNWSEWFGEPIKDLLASLGATYTIKDTDK